MNSDITFFRSAQVWTMNYLLSGCKDFGANIYIDLDLGARNCAGMLYDCNLYKRKNIHCTNRGLSTLLINTSPSSIVRDAITWSYSSDGYYYNTYYNIYIYDDIPW